MKNNDILRRIRYIFDYNDSKMISLFAMADLEVSRGQVSDWLKKDDDPAFKELYDKDLAVFLNGLINDQRGKREGEQAPPEKKLNNNIILRKLKIAFDLKDHEILEILSLVDFRLGKHELSAFFRKTTQSQYRACKDQILRNFLHGLQIKYHLNKEKEPERLKPFPGNKKSEPEILKASRIDRTRKRK